MDVWRKVSEESRQERTALGLNKPSAQNALSHLLSYPPTTFELLSHIFTAKGNKRFPRIPRLSRQQISQLVKP
jgi:hypothetical protein